MQDMEKYLEKAGVLIEALPYIREFHGKTIVVKYGGSAMVEHELKKNVIRDVALLKLVGFRPIIVHGGGKEISRWVEKAEMVLNKINKGLTSMMEKIGVRAVGISGKDGSLLMVDKKYANGEDIGYVGEIKQVNTEILQTLLENDIVPVVCPIGSDDQFHSHNINADDAACAIATAMGASKLAFLTDIEGVYRDPSDKSSLISSLTIQEAEELLSSGCVGGGMLPKIRNCVDAVKAGVGKVHILDGRLVHSLLLEFFTKEGIGTVILGEEEQHG